MRSVNKMTVTDSGLGALISEIGNPSEGAAPPADQNNLPRDSRLASVISTGGNMQTINEFKYAENGRFSAQNSQTNLKGSFGMVPTVKAAAETSTVSRGQFQPHRTENLSLNRRLLFGLANKLTKDQVLHYQKVGQPAEASNNSSPLQGLDRETSSSVGLAGRLRGIKDKSMDFDDPAISPEHRKLKEVPMFSRISAAFGSQPPSSNNLRPSNANNMLFLGGFKPELSTSSNHLRPSRVMGGDKLNQFSPSGEDPWLTILKKPKVKVPVNILLSAPKKSTVNFQALGSTANNFKNLVLSAGQREEQQLVKKLSSDFMIRQKISGAQQDISDNEYCKWRLEQLNQQTVHLRRLMSHEATLDELLRFVLRDSDTVCSAEEKHFLRSKFSPLQLVSFSDYRLADLEQRSAPEAAEFLVALQQVLQNKLSRIEKELAKVKKVYERGILIRQSLKQTRKTPAFRMTERSGATTGSWIQQNLETSQASSGIRSERRIAATMSDHISSCDSPGQASSQIPQIQLEEEIRDILARHKIQMIRSVQIKKQMWDFSKSKPSAAGSQKLSQN